MTNALTIEQKKELVELFNNKYSNILYYSSDWDSIYLETGDLSEPIDYDGITTVEELKDRVIQTVVDERDYLEHKMNDCENILDLWR